MSSKLLLTISAVLLSFLCISLLPATVNGYAYKTLLGKRFRFESRSISNNFLRLRSDIRNTEVRLDTYKGYDTMYDVVPGLAGFGVSLRSVNWPDRYLRQSSCNCFVNQFSNTATFRKDATWIPRPGLYDARNGVSFESVRYPGQYMRNRDKRVLISRLLYGKAWYRMATTFTPRLIRNVVVSGEWTLVYGNDNGVSNGEVTIVIEEGITIATSESTSQTVENSWKASVEAEASGSYAGIGFSLKAMFETSGLRSVTTTSSSSWAKETKITKALTFSLVKSVPFYYWQWCVHATTADSSYITSKTDIYSQTSTRNPPNALN